MPSPLVNRLTKSIIEAENSVQQACLRADLACYWARVGEFAAAEELKSCLRSKYGKGENLNVSVRLLCLDALLLFYRDSSPQSRDRMLRAKLLSRASGDKSLIALTSSWLAQLDFNYNKVESMLANIAETLEAIDAGDEAAECRVSLVLAGLFLFVDDASSAKIWHEKARNLAVGQGDQAAIGALLYNHAIYKLTLARLRVYDNSDYIINKMELDVDVRNAINYQHVAQVSSLSPWLETLEIYYLLIDCRYSEAERKIKYILSGNRIPRDSSQYLILEADLLFVRSKNPDGIGMDCFAHLDQIDLTALNAEDKSIVLQSWVGAAKAIGMDLRAADWHSLRQSEMAKRSEFVENVKMALASWRV